MEDDASVPKHEKLQPRDSQPIFIKGTWFASRFDLSITDDLNVWVCRCRASEDAIRYRSTQWNQPAAPKYVSLAYRGSLHKAIIPGLPDMIAGVAMNGDARKSMELFEKMVGDKIQPTETTFVALLSACRHAKMVDKGLELFDQMCTFYEVKPRLQHYACVVDLLARSGMLEEAEKFIEEKMGGLGRGDANVWGALLSACRVHGNFEVGNRIWKSGGHY